MTDEPIVDLPRSTFDSRVFPLDDIEIMRAEQGGDGRTVRAYAAVYERPVKIDEMGEQYEEIIRAGAFTRTIQRNREPFQVFYNHGMDLYGKPSDRFAMPIGRSIEVSEDRRGVLTVTRYAQTPLADEILELIREGAIRGQSFSGEWIKSRLVRAALGKLDRVERTEVSMREYGPTPFPVYESAQILSVRSEPNPYKERIDALREWLRDGFITPDEARAAALATIADTPSPPAEGTGAVDPSTETTPETTPAVEAPSQGPSLELLSLAQAQRRRKETQ